MRTSFVSFILLLALLGAPAGLAGADTSADTPTPEPVEFVRGMRLLDLDGELHRLGFDDGTRGTVIVLLETDCPIASRYAPDLNALADRAQQKGLGFYAVISDPRVTPEEMRAMRDGAGLRYPILVDSTGDLALRLAPSAVPQAFLIDAHDQIVYRGRIDNRFVSVGRLRQQITEHDLRDAIDAVAAGERVEVSETQPVGCVFEAWSDTLPEQVTYTQHIQPLLAANCVECHTAGGIAPFALDSYRTASRRAGMMSQVTEDGVMPPWQADPHYRRFRDERTLSNRQIAFLRAWAETGRVQGEPTFALPEREMTRGWPLGPPDAVVTMEEPYELPASGDDQYRRFVMKSPFDEPVTIVAIGFQPGDPRVVHHANIFYDSEGEARRRDAADPGPGYDAFGSKEAMQETYEWDTEGFGIGGWAPGADGYRLPARTGMRLPAGGDIMVEIHYHLSGRETSDQSSIAFYLAKEPVDHYADGLIMGSLDVDIAPGESDYLRHIYMDVPVDMQIVDMFPHMHYLGTEMWAEATTAEGDKIPLVHIPDWDFRWQNFYQFPEPLTIPAGSRIDAWFRYDNSAENPDNPSVPPQPVQWGWQSTDEMLEIWMTTIYTGARDSQRLQRAGFGSFYRGAEPERAAEAPESRVVRASTEGRERATNERAERPPVGSENRFQPYEAPPLNIVGLSTTTMFTDGRYEKAIERLWEDFSGVDLWSRLPDVVDERVYVVYSEQDMSRGSFRVTIGHRTSGSEPAPGDLHTIAVPGAKYAVFAPEWKGPETVSDIWSRVWSSDLPMAGTYDFEIYELDDSSMQIESAMVWVALRE